jgi:uncharacterized protein
MAQSISVVSSVQNIVSDYAKALRRQNVPFDQIVLFGSHAQGTQREGSDIDICIVSPLFGDDYHKALVSLMHATLDIDGNLDVVPYTPQDLADKYDPLAHEIRTHGKVMNV